MPYVIFFFQAEDGIRDTSVTGVQTCALPILDVAETRARVPSFYALVVMRAITGRVPDHRVLASDAAEEGSEIGRASCRERVEISVEGGVLQRKKWKLKETV